MGTSKFLSATGIEGNRRILINIAHIIAIEEKSDRLIFHMIGDKVIHVKDSCEELVERMAE